MTTLQNHQEMLNTMERWEPVLDGLAFATVGFLLYKSVEKLTGKEALCFSVTQWGLVQFAKWTYPAGYMPDRYGGDESHGYVFKLLRSSVVIIGTYLLLKAFTFGARELKSTHYFPESALGWGTFGCLTLKVMMIVGMIIRCKRNFSIPNTVAELDGVPHPTLHRLHEYFAGHHEEWNERSTAFQLRLLTLYRYPNSSFLLTVQNDGTINQEWIENLPEEELTYYFDSYSGANSLPLGEVESLERYRNRQPCRDQPVLDAVCIRAAQLGFFTDQYQDWQCYQAASDQAKLTAQAAIQAALENG